MKQGKMKQLMALILAGMLTVGSVGMPVFGAENGGGSDTAAVAVEIVEEETEETAVETEISEMEAGSIEENHADESDESDDPDVSEKTEEFEAAEESEETDDTETVADEKFNPEYWNYAKLISGVLRYRMPIDHVIKLVSSLQLKSESINTWKVGVERALKKYIVKLIEDDYNNNGEKYEAFRELSEKIVFFFFFS